MSEQATQLLNELREKGLVTEAEIQLARLQVRRWKENVLNK
jgi:hypothetical protein